MAVLKAFPPRSDNLIVIADALGNENKEFTLEVIKKRLLEEGERAHMRESKWIK